MKCLLPNCYALLELACAGCSGLTTFTEKAADTEDKALQSALWVQCQAISVGAWDRAFGQSAELAAAWRTLCKRPRNEAPIR